jgi:hypothetical protein
VELVNAMKSGKPDNLRRRDPDFYFSGGAPFNRLSILIHNKNRI